MAKSKKNNLTLIFSCCTILFALLGVILYMVLDAVKDCATGAQVVFGATGVDFFGALKGGLKFSFLLFLGVIFAVAGLVITILPLAGVKCKLFPIIAIACFVVAAVFAFLSVNCAVTYTEVLGKTSTSMGVDNGKLGIGAILAGVFYICAGCASALPIVLDKK